MESGSVFRKHEKSGTVKAKALRKNMTEQERKLWHGFLKSYSVRILRQKVINHYIADFYCAKAQLAIELDGNHHYTEDGLEYDKIREDVLMTYGIAILRFRNEEIDNDFYNVCQRIDNTIKQRLNLTNRQSPPC